MGQNQSSLISANNTETISKEDITLIPSVNLENIEDKEDIFEPRVETVLIETKEQKEDKEQEQEQWDILEEQKEVEEQKEQYEELEEQEDEKVEQIQVEQEDIDVILSDEKIKMIVDRLVAEKLKNTLENEIEEKIEQALIRHYNRIGESSLVYHPLENTSQFTDRLNKIESKNIELELEIGLEPQKEKSEQKELEIGLGLYTRYCYVCNKYFIVSNATTKCTYCSSYNTEHIIDNIEIFKFTENSSQCLRCLEVMDADTKHETCYLDVDTPRCYHIDALGCVVCIMCEQFFDIDEIRGNKCQCLCSSPSCHGSESEIDSYSYKTEIETETGLKQTEESDRDKELINDYFYINTRRTKNTRKRVKPDSDKERRPLYVKSQKKKRERKIDMKKQRDEHRASRERAW